MCGVGIGGTHSAARGVERLEIVMGTNWWMSAGLVAMGAAAAPRSRVAVALGAARGSAAVMDWTAGALR